MDNNDKEVNDSTKKNPVAKVHNDLDKKKKIVNISKFSDLTSSDNSIEGGLDVYGNQYGKLCSIVDKLQDHQW